MAKESRRGTHTSVRGEAPGDASTPSVDAPEPDAATLDAFARAVLRRVAAPPADGPRAKGTTAVRDAFAFVDARRPGDIALRLTDPLVTLHGSPPAGTVLEVSCDDRPFIVTTVKEELGRWGLRVVRMLHPVFGVERDATGRLAAVLPARSAARRETFLQAELSSRITEEARPALVDGVRRVLADVFAVTEDHFAMRSEVEWVIGQTGEHAGLRFPVHEVAETVAFLDWLLDDNFVLLGCMRLGDPSRALGILSRRGASLRQLPADAGDPPRLIRICATPEQSTVDRRRPIHRIDVADVGSDGRIAGVFRVVGVFSQKASTEPATVIPMLRLKLRRILELEDVVDGSEEEAKLVSLFQVLPKDLLFESDVPALREVLSDLLAAEDRQGVQALLRVEPASHAVSALVSVPQERYSAALRQRIERFLVQQLDGTRVESHVSLGDRAEAILRLVVHIDGPLPDPPLDSLALEVRQLCRTWDQELAAAAGERVGDQEGRRLGRAWGDWFPADYRGAVPAGHAVEELLQLERLSGAPQDFSVVLTRDPSGRAEGRFKVYSSATAVELSRFLPILESLGLWAIEERVHSLGPAGGRVHLHDFAVTDPVAGPLDIDRDGPRLAEAAIALWHGQAEVDSLNRLVLRAGMAWADVALLRAYHRYRNQVTTPFTTAYVAQVLVENPAAARAMVELFAARFDPRRDAVPDDVEDIRRRVEEGCEAVARLDHDRVLRGFAALVEATLRTNRYFGEGTHLALKFDSSAVPGARPPIPYREIFVFGPKVEGIHLRWGPVARGGVRRSERPDDYRSEVLGLMRAQVLKNALIVPTGAKGGFVVKRGRRGGATAADGREAYEIFVRALLDLTDNIVGDRVVPVATRQDGDDPYLVVAADSGTAAFSDLANEISMQRGFWLGDAFASGGSHGYHHKRLGITARGTWVAVRHHFAELGVDLEGYDGVRATPADDGVRATPAESTTVVGIGDMSGDVFGNFMLQSDRIRLVAAFDHRDIFIDPDPDPVASFQERARLFALPSSSWQDYDRSRLSPGGGVWSRLDKRIPLSPEARAALGIEEDRLSSPDLIRAILQAPVGLLFAGGIGTFVRASTEPDTALDDPANSELRVVGSAIRARVVGEGANLAFTQRARIEFARRGGRINTDAIDNSAGVDISDREVNLKILLRPAVEAGEITWAERDALLEDVCNDVVAAVLRDSAQQSLGLSRAQTAAPSQVAELESVIAGLEATGVLDRVVEGLPTSEEMKARASGRTGLTRPELAVVLAGAKRRLTAQLLASGVPDQPALRAVLVAYFPPRLSAEFEHCLDGHRLRRELIASQMANAVVNRMGPTFVSRLATETGVAPAMVAAAYWVGRGVAGSSAYWRELDREPGASAEAASVLTALLESLTRTYLGRGVGGDIGAAVALDRPAFAQLEAGMLELGSVQQRRRIARRAEVLIDSGLDPSTAHRWAALAELAMVPAVADLARGADHGVRATQAGRDVIGVAQAFLLLSEALGVDRLLDRLHGAVPGDRWSQAAWRGLAGDLDALRRAGTGRALAEHPDDDPVAAAQRFLEGRAARIAHAVALVREIEREQAGMRGPNAVVSLDAVAVATRAIRDALEPP